VHRSPSRTTSRPWRCPPPSDPTETDALAVPGTLRGHRDGDTLLIGEGGQGGDDCAPPPPAEPPTDDDEVCDGFTAGISAVQNPGSTVDGDAERIVDGLYSVESAAGSIGSAGVAATGLPGVLLIAQGDPRRAGGGGDRDRRPVTVFAAYESDDDATPEFVPSALQQDEDGNVYVGGVGSFVPGLAEVVRHDADGDETGRWDGFTAINGLTVDEVGEHVYVSQIAGSAADGNGNVVRFDTEDETWTSFDVPFPSGLTLEPDDSDGGNGSDDPVYVSAFSTFPADADDSATPDVVEGGQVWRFSFPEDAEESPLPVTTPPGGAAAP
jgi:hypothetical protein